MKFEEASVFAQVLLVGLLLAILVFIPFTGIWALNTLFGLSIQYGFWEWLAMIIVIVFFGRPNIKVSKIN